MSKSIRPGRREEEKRKGFTMDFFDDRGRNDSRVRHEIEDLAHDVIYKVASVGKCRIDLLVNIILIVELKTVDSLNPVHRSQAITYLKPKKLPLALLINFNVAILKDGIKRVINT